MIYWKDLASYIKKRRIAKNISIREISKEFAINKDKYLRIENGIQEPSFEELQNILKYFDMELFIIHK